MRWVSLAMYGDLPNGTYPWVVRDRSGRPLLSLAMCGGLRLVCTHRQCSDALRDRGGGAAPPMLDFLPHFSTPLRPFEDLAGGSHSLRPSASKEC